MSHLPYMSLDRADARNYQGGDLPDFTVVFGHAPALTSEGTIWEYYSSAANETMLTTGTTLYLSSDDNGDTDTITVGGLDENWEPYVAQVALTGQTQVQVGNTNGWTRVFTMFQSSAEPPYAGTVYCAELDAGILAGVPQTASLVKGTMVAPEQQLRKANYTVPVGYKLMVGGLTAGMQSAGSGSTRSVNVHLDVQTLATGATAANPSWNPWRRFIESVISTTAPYISIQPREKTGPFPALTNLRVHADATAASDVVCSLQMTLIKDTF
jgi:hypothetical protein